MFSRKDFAINITPPADLRFSHPVDDQPTSGTPVRQDPTFGNMFREPAYAPGTLLPEPDMDEPTPMPVRRGQYGHARPRRTDRRRPAA